VCSGKIKPGGRKKKATGGMVDYYKGVI